MFTKKVQSDNVFFYFALILSHLRVISIFSGYFTNMFFIDHFKHKDQDRRYNVIDVSERTPERPGDS